MSASERLESAVDRRVQRTPHDAPAAGVLGLDAIRRAAANDARRRGTDPAALLARMADPELGDRLLAEAEQEAHRERLARKADILLARLPALYRDCDYPRTAWGLAAQNWTADYRERRRQGKPGRSLVILGDVGPGKTHTLCAIARDLLTTDFVPVMVTTVLGMIESVKPSAGMDVDLLQYSLTPVLGLDDLGAERMTEFAAEQLYRLAHERSHNGLPTIVTSNLSGQDIRARYDLRTVERLFGGAQLIQIDGVSRRAMPF